MKKTRSVMNLNVETFFCAVVSQNQEELRKYFHEHALIRWHCTNELFTVNEYIKANCEYPGNWEGEIERFEKVGNLTILVCRIYPRDKAESFHVVSFIRTEDDLIIEMDEYWSDDGSAPEWRRQMKIGKPIH